MAGLVVYDGPSAIDGGPVLGILTHDSSNAKTGRMSQLWILRPDMSPTEASRTGADVSLCGGCPHRGRYSSTPDGGRALTPGTRSCYVTLFQGPRSVWSAWAAGSYRAAESLADIRAAGRGRRVRLGAYGDPAALPLQVVRALVADADGWTGYTHQWRKAANSDWRQYLQASVDSLRELEQATARGWGTFYVAPEGAPLPDGVTECANSRTGVQCIDCLECDGRGARHIGIHAHGSGRGAIARRALPLLT
jgi:hypothetical protein